MITEITIRNFKALKNAHLKTRNLNLFTGLNGMGKSSLIQSLLLLRQSYQQNVLQEIGLALRGELAEIGTGLDAFFQHAAKEDTIDFKIVTSEYKTFSWCFKYIAEANLLPLADKGVYSQKVGDFNLFNNNFQYLNAEHAAPKLAYSKSEFEVVQQRQLGIKGEHTVHFLSVYGSEEITESLQHPRSKSSSLIHTAEAWLSEISPGSRFKAENVPGLDMVKLSYNFETQYGYTNDFRPGNVGFGITYVLPVIVALLSAKPGSIVILENPESHLHPRGQSRIGRLISLAAQSGVQLFVETHSDHILNGIRVAVKDKYIDRENVSISYFERENSGSEHASHIKPISIDPNGELSEYPEGFLDEWNNQLLNLL